MAMMTIKSEIFLFLSFYVSLRSVDRETLRHSKNIDFTGFACNLYGCIYIE